MLPEPLVEHLRSWVGAWPPDQGHVQVVGNPRNDEPSWDGSIRPVLGVADADGGAVVGVPPSWVPRVTAPFADLDALERELPAALGMPDHRVFAGVFRWSVTPAPLEDVGVWIPHDDPRVPEWLHPFGADVLVVLDGDTYVAGVGLKRHDAWGREISVGTEEAARGRGLARRLVAQATRRIVDEGHVATYLHAPDNIGSARAADAAGFPDLGWKVLGLFRADATAG